MNCAAGKQSRTVRSEQSRRILLAQNMKAARKALGPTLASRTKVWLETLTREFGFSVKGGDLQIINSNWYVTHTGLLLWRVVKNAAEFTSRPSSRCVIRPQAGSS